jgi:hypothetical protein
MFTLPSLTKALNPQTVSAALAAALPDFQPSNTRILRCDVSPLRFRPGRRCTMRLDVWLREKDSGVIYKRVLYGKIYHDLEKAEHVYNRCCQSRSAPPSRSVSFATASAFLRS